MKKLIIVLLLLAICSVMFAGSIFKYIIPNTISIAQQSLFVDNVLEQYMLEIETSNDNLYSRIKNTYFNKTTYKEHEFRIQHQYKFIKGRARWWRNEFIDINMNLYQLDLRLATKGWSFGGIQAWDTSPSTWFVFGKEFKLNIDFLLPGYIHTTSDFTTQNFKDWHYENSIQLKLRTEIKIFENIANLFIEDEEDKITIPSSYLKVMYRLKDYGIRIQETLFGFEVDF